VTVPLNPYDAETEAAVLKFRELYAEIAAGMSDDNPRSQRSHATTAFIRAQVQENMAHIGHRPEMIAFLVNEELNREMEAHRKRLTSSTPTQNRLT